MTTAAGKLHCGLSGLWLLASAVSAAAQGYPPYPAQQPPAASPGYPPRSAAPAAPGQQAQSARSPVCVQLEGQLVALDRGAMDPARADQIRRYEDAANKQQFELDRLVSQSRRAGCQGLGFFSLFGGQPPQCSQINRQIQDMRTNLDTIMQNLSGLQNNTADREAQRRSILLALGQNDCGPQYRTAAAQPRSFFDALFGPGSILSPRSPYQSSSTFRTVCVRSCDGYYFPISYATTPDRFAEDEQTCQRMCPAAEVHLYSYHNPGEEIEQAVSLSGQYYTQLPNAFHYRQQVDKSCSCRRAGQSWADALKQFQDDTIQYGDIVVTDENAKKLSQPKVGPSKQQASSGGRTESKPQSGAASATSASQPAGGDNSAAEKPAGKRQVRSVGPIFYPVQ